MNRTVITMLAMFLLLTAPSISLATDNPVINSILAVVEDKPVTIHDLNTVFYPQKHYTLTQIKEDPNALRALNVIILRELINLEAKERRISVSDAEINLYIVEVAKRNQLSTEDFEKALQSEGRSYESYKQEIKTEILRTRIANKIFQEGTAVSGLDLEKYFDKHPDLKSSGTKFKLRQILITAPGEVDAVVQEIRRLTESGTEFSTLATRLSDSPEAKQGGLLGIIAKEDLSPLILDAVEDLKDGEVSRAVKSPAGYHIFSIEKRYEQDSDELSPELKQDLTEIIKKQEIAGKVEIFFSSELMSKYTVDRRI